MGDVAGVTIQEQLRDEADSYERAADINFTDHEWREDSPRVQGNLSSAARMRAAASRIDALEAALREIEIHSSGADLNDDSEPAQVCRHIEFLAHRTLESS